MTLPTSEPLPDEYQSLPPARRRRKRRSLIPFGSDERAAFLDELSRRTTPSFDFFLYSLLSGVILGVAILMDAPAVYVLAALAAPFMAPVIGLSLGGALGSWEYFLRSLVSLLISGVLVFAAGAIAGYISWFLPPESLRQLGYHASFTWPDFALLTIGALAAAFFTARRSDAPPPAVSAALAYELYLPLGAASFSWVSGETGFWPSGLGLFAANLAWAVLLGMLLLGLFRLKPRSASGYALQAVLAAAAVVGVVTASGLWRPSPIQAPELFPELESTALPEAETPWMNTPSPEKAGTASTVVSQTSEGRLTVTATSASASSPTPTITLTPTPVFALIHAGEFNGALIRSEPNPNSTVVKSLMNGSQVEVLPEEARSGAITWVRVRTSENIEGWIVRGLLVMATPAPVPTP